MNWGNKIVVAFILFVVFILYMVVQAFQQNTDLVADDYYAQEINYQQRLEQKANLKKLGDKVSIQLVGKSIALQFPKGQNPKGEIHFYHPSRELFDQKITIDTDAENKQLVAREKLIAGNYRINITWQSDGTEYFQQEKLFIQ